MSDLNRANGHRFNGFRYDPEPTLDPAHRVDPHDIAFDPDRLFKAVFGLEARVPADAFTAQSLGREREGNGVLIDADGHVLTIGYLVTEAERVWLTASDGQRLRAEPVGFDQVTGFGLVRLAEPYDAVPVTRGRLADLRRGALAVIAGQGGLARAQKVTVVSRREFAGYWEYLLDEAIFTAPPYPRWSGAGLFGRDGRLHGIASLFVQDAGPGDRQLPGNMVVPIDLLEPILEDLIVAGRPNRPPRPWLGLFTAEANGRLVVAGMAEGGPSARAGLKTGDIVLALDGEPMKSLGQFYRRLWAVGPAGADVHLQIYRDGVARQVRVRTADRHAYLKMPLRH